MLIEDQIFEKGKKSIILCEDDRTALDVEKVLKSNFLDFNITYFPAHDFVAFSDSPSSSEIILGRASCFEKLDRTEILIITINCLLTKFSINEDLLKKITIKNKSKIKLNDILEQLVFFGYNNQNNVHTKLEFSLRGDILDIYSSANKPFRISLFDDEIESIKEFDPYTQLSTNDKIIDKIDVFNSSLEFTVPNNPLYSILDYYKADRFIAFNSSDILIDQRIIFLEEVYKSLELENKLDDYFLNLMNFKEFEFGKLNFTPANSFLNINKIDSLEYLLTLQKKIHIYQGGSKSSLFSQYEEMLKKSIFVDNSKISFLSTAISKNYLFNNEFHINAFLKQLKPTNSDQSVLDFNDLALGDPVVHQKHGIGRFVAIDRMPFSDKTREFIKIIYRNNDKLLLPVENLNLVTRYGFEDSSLILDKLGSADWLSRKSNIKKKIRFIADKLLKNAAKRLNIKTVPFEFNQSDLDKFNQSFEYVETPDQLTAIEQSLSDLTLGKPANRLICGDVGFGKTEVALRIACATYLSGHQFVIVVPTTLLAMQHFKTFTNRFSSMNVNVASLSRFSSLKEKELIYKGLGNGDIQILVCTHSLFKRDVAFNNLGTLIIDEEQKFGVVQKEFLINKYPQIHIFSLSATPIPRTLQMSLIGLRDLSLIGTPPTNRITIRTYVQKYERVVLLTAIKNELDRNGQIFIVVPRISHIPFVVSEIQKIGIDLNYSIGHSKLKEKEIEEVFINFSGGTINCLISTNIIESGIDIKNANTLIVFNSNLFGLSQLYQLRGRVGRSDRRAYAYLFHDSEKLISKSALKKLQVLSNYENLGSNFQLATEDLEIRGAGNLLGDEQSGHVKDVGIEMYQNMLKDEIGRLNSKNYDEKDEEFEEFEFDAFFEYFIPKSYIVDDISRLIFYRKLTNAKNYKEIKNTEYELIDRYGNYPDEIQNLFNLLKIKIQSLSYGIVRLNIQRTYIDLKINIKNEKLSKFFIQLVQEGMIKMISSDTIRIKNNIDKDYFYVINLFYKKIEGLISNE